MENPNPLALTLIVIGALMGFGREWLLRWYLWVFKKVQRQEPTARLGAAVKLYLVMTSFIFTMAGLMGLFGIWKY
jgi:hypothetical protein